MEGSPPQAGGVKSPVTPTSPVSSRRGEKRKRGSFVDHESSPGSDEQEEKYADTLKKRQPGVKRACNECRQQKLRCDVVQDPFASCSRCNRLRLICKIESNFKRIGKRSKHAEMEKEIERLRGNIRRAKAQGFVVDDDDEIQSPVAASNYTHTRNPSLMGSDEAVSSLLTLKQGGSGSYGLQHYTHELENVRLTAETVSLLFREFFMFYHQFLPFLNMHQTPDQYFQQHPLLFWAIIAVASRRYRRDGALLTNLSRPLSNLLWNTIGEVPSSYFVVKALCLLCTWPLPTSTTTSDPTHILCGVMMKLATMIGLHRPSHSQDFSRVSIDLNQEQLHDRVITWAACNIVAQSVGTGYGQPASTLYDWTLAIRPGDEGPFQLSQSLEARLQIERFCDKVSKEMYSNASDPRGVAGDEHRAMLMRVFRRDFGELQAAILSRISDPDPIITLHLRAAALHLRLAGFFDSNNTPGYMDDLMGLWKATTSFLDGVLEVEKVAQSPEAQQENVNVRGSILMHSTNYISQMLVAAGFTLLKLLRSFFAKVIDFERGRALFHQAIAAVRTSSVVHNDLQSRLAELMVQMWNGARLDTIGGMYNANEDSPIQIDDSLQLKVRCRHSMSLVFDSVWRWREEYQAVGRGTLESLKHPTNPDSAAQSSASSTHLDSTLIPPPLPGSTMLTSNGALTPSATGLSAAPSGPNSLIGSMTYADATSNYDFFDPQAWMLDGLVTFDYGPGGLGSVVALEGPS